MQGDRSAIVGWLVFVVVSLAWMSALFCYLLPNSHYAFRLGSVGMPAIAAHYALYGLPLALACILIRRTGYPGAAWAVLGLLATVTVVWLIMAMLAFNSGATPPVEDFMRWSGISAAIISLPAWLGFCISWAWERWAGRSSSDKA